MEKRRREGLDGVLNEMPALDRFRTLLERLRRIDRGMAEPRTIEFLRWAEGELARREAELLPEALERRYSEIRLFGEGDDHGYKSPYRH